MAPGGLNFLSKHSSLSCRSQREGPGGLFFFKNPSVFDVEAIGIPQLVPANPFWCDLFFQITRVHVL
jgi:hypothetical protein